MMTQKEATKHADEMTKLHGEKWLVCRTPDGAHCNQTPANLYNTGRYVACKESEKQVYQDGGCTFDDA